MLKTSWSNKSNYCFQCGGVFLEDELTSLRIGTGNRRTELYCKDCYKSPPKHLPHEQRERWYHGLRKKHIQSDDSKRRKRELG